MTLKCYALWNVNICLFLLANDVSLYSVVDFKLLCTASKLRYFSDFKLGISIPVRGESSELLNADGEKNDYDWWVQL